MSARWRSARRSRRSLELNGICDVFGHKNAIFVLTQPDIWTAPRSFMLAEGESQYGIKLLAVDMTSHHVAIKKDGLKQSLRLRSIMNLPPSPVSEAGNDTAKISARVGNGLSGNIDSDNSVDDRLAGNPGYGSLPARGGSIPTPTKDSSRDRTSASGSKSSNSNGLDPAVALQDQSQTEWYQQSAVIEQNRQETAPAVLAGEMTPWPRTPLTPSETSSKLVGSEAFYSDHIPGYRQPLDF